MATKATLFHQYQLASGLRHPMSVTISITRERLTLGQPGQGKRGEVDLDDVEENAELAMQYSELVQARVC